MRSSFWNEKGIYTLVLHLASGEHIVVGALGRIYFEKGYYTYTGSAWGTAGLKRVLRHLSVAQSKTRKWHIDYLLPATTVEGCVLSFLPSSCECAVARALSGGMASVKGFGCSDCSCASHLHYCEYCPVQHVLSAHRQAAREMRSHGHTCSADHER
ncbi:MAG: GIY-YIG nuclease family protein [Methermicoccaceae archaeon]